eukprot:2607304-Rhodomonas_salina.1
MSVPHSQLSTPHSPCRSQPMSVTAHVSTVQPMSVPHSPCQYCTARTTQTTTTTRRRMSARGRGRTFEEGAIGCEEAFYEEAQCCQP